MNKTLAPGKIMAAFAMLIVAAIASTVSPLPAYAVQLMQPPVPKWFQFTCESPSSELTIGLMSSNGFPTPSELAPNHYEFSEYEKVVLAWTDSEGTPIGFLIGPSDSDLRISSNGKLQLDNSGRMFDAAGNEIKSRADFWDVESGNINMDAYTAYLASFGLVPVSEMDTDVYLADSSCLIFGVDGDSAYPSIRVVWDDEFNHEIAAVDNSSSLEFVRLSYGDEDMDENPWFIMSRPAPNGLPLMTVSEFIAATDIQKYPSFHTVVSFEPFDENVGGENKAYRSTSVEISDIVFSFRRLVEASQDGAYASDFIELPPAANFDDVGIYQWRVVRHSTASSESFHASEEEYILTLSVVRDDRGNFHYGNSFIQKIGEESDIEPEKLIEASWTHLLSALTSISVTKEVEGAFASETFPFEIEISLELPEWYVADDIHAAGTHEHGQDYDAHWSVISDEGSVLSSDIVRLAAGDTVTFDVPPGTTYTVTEIADEDGHVADDTSLVYSPSFSTSAESATVTFRYPSMAEGQQESELQFPVQSGSLFTVPSEAMISEAGSMDIDHIRIEGYSSTATGVYAIVWREINSAAYYYPGEKLVIDDDTVLVPCIIYSQGDGPVLNYMDFPEMSTTGKAVGVYLLDSDEITDPSVPLYIENRYDEEYGDKWSVKIPYYTGSADYDGRTFLGWQRQGNPNVLYRPGEVRMLWRDDVVGDQLHRNDRLVPVFSSSLSSEVVE